MTSSTREQRKILEAQTEPLLAKDQKRNGLYPLQKPNIWSYYKLHEASHWIAEEIDLSKDYDDWNNLTDDERHYLKYTLAFFAGSDFIINESQEKDGEQVCNLEYKFFNADKIARENIHSTTYANLLEEYVKDEKERDMLKNAITTISTVKRKTDWMRKYISEGSFVERVLAEAIMEGIFFSGSFCSIYWVKKRGLLPSLSDANEFIARDEGIHRDFNCMIYRDEIINKLTEEDVIEMVKEAVEIEQEFVRDALPVKLIGMNSDMMSQYICFVADNLLYNLIYKTYFKVENPFDWMTSINLGVLTDFFVHRPTNYGKTEGVNGSEDNKISFATDF